MKKIWFFVIGFAALFIISYFLRQEFDLSEDDIAVEFHGLLFDLLFFGIILTIYEASANKSRDIKRWIEELDDYRGWHEKEAGFRVVGIIRRLNSKGYYRIDLSNCYFEAIELRSLNFDSQPNKKHIISADTSSLKMREVKIINCSFENYNFSQSTFDLYYVDMALFQSCNFTDFEIILNRVFYGTANSASLKFDKCQFNSGKFRDINSIIYKQIDFINCAFKKVHFDKVYINYKLFKNCTFVNCIGLPEQLVVQGDKEPFNNA